MALSLFGRSQHLYHFVAEQDVAEELFSLLIEAKAIYLREVVGEGKRYHRYVDDFVNSHRYIDCNNAICRNCHEMNVHIIKGLLSDCAQFIQPYFTAETFSFEDCMALKRMYDKTEVQPFGVHSAIEPTNAPPLSFGCNFTHEQMTGIVSCAETYHLFCVSKLRIEDMEALFACKNGFHLRVNNIRRVVLLFDALLENSFIHSRWQTVLDKGHFLMSKDGSRFVSSSSLSSALSAVRNNMTSVAYGIRRAVDHLKE